MCHCILFDKEQNPFLYHLFYEGYVGVSFFFILSGFILAYAYQDRFVEGSISKQSFYVARLARIYPLHILTMLIWVYMRKDHPLNEPYIVNFFSNIFLVQSFYPTDEIRFNAAAWSLSDEMFFYLLFPFVTLWLTQYKYKLLTGFAVISLLILALCPVFSGSKNEEWFFYTFPPVRILDFMLGIFLYNLCEKIKRYNWQSLLNSTLLEIFAVIIFATFYATAYFIPQVYRHSFWYWLPVGLLISVFYFQSGYISKILSNKFLVWLGEISFAFYLLQPIVKWYIKRAFFLLDIPILMPVVFILGVTLSVIVSGLSLKYFETPANKWVKSKFSTLLINKKV